MSTEDSGVGGGAPPADEHRKDEEFHLASFPTRLVQTFFSPGALAEGLAKKPAWGLAMVVGMVLVVGSLLLIPADVWQTFAREQMLARGQDIPEGFGSGTASMLIRASTVVFGAIGYAIFNFAFAGLVTLIFAFIMGDEGRYRQYLSILAHAWLIPAFVGLLLVPLRIAQEDPQVTLNMGSFLFFLGDGYLARVARMLDLSQAWAWLVVAQGAHAIDKRRSFGSAATAVLILFVAMAMLFGLMPGAG